MSRLKYFRIIVSLILSAYFLSYATHAKNLGNWNIIDSVDLIFHEAGHSIFIFFGEFIHVLSGSAFQIFVPLVFVVYFALWRKEIFSASLLLFWVGQNIINVSIYMGDSLKQQLPLLGGDGVIHDWNYLLSATGLLKYTNILSTITYDIGLLTIIVAGVMGVYFSWYNPQYEPTTNKRN